MKDDIILDDEQDFDADSAIDVLLADGVISSEQREAADAYIVSVKHARARDRSAKEETQFTYAEREMLESVLLDGLSLEEYAEATSADSDDVQTTFCFCLTELVRVYGL